MADNTTMQTSTTYPSKEILDDQKNKIENLCDCALTKGDSWYLIDIRWLRQWKKYVTNDGDVVWDSENASNLHPGPIDNTELYSDGTFLKEGLMDEVNFSLLPQQAWDYFVEMYGIAEGQEPIQRKVIEEGFYSKSLVVEIYPIHLKLARYKAGSNNSDNAILKFVSRTTKISQLEDDMRKLFLVAKERSTKMWAIMEKKYEKLEGHKTLEDCSLQKGQLVVIEVQDDNGKWPYSDTLIPTSSAIAINGTNNHNNQRSSFGSGSLTNCNYKLRNSPTNTSYNTRIVTPGLCGLSNLGNTCFMNSALQCLSNVPALTNYFRCNEYKKELNCKNPLGTGGKLAEAYAHLIHTMWSGQHSSFSPREFKMSVGHFAPRFSGYQQHDSQELFSFLVDGLHEDLNRISKKPYIEIEEAGDRPDTEVAEESWTNHRRRNDSIVVDTLHGLFRSTVDCPECPRISVTFDPFCFLSLPLPTKRERQLEVAFVPLDQSESIMKYKVTVQKSGTVADLCEALSKLNGKDPKLMVAADVYNNRFHKIFKPLESVKNIYDKDYIYIYEKLPDRNMLPLYWRYTSYGGSYHLFGHPLLIPVDFSSTNYKDLYHAAMKAAYRHCGSTDLKEMIEKHLQTTAEVTEDENMNGDDKVEVEQEGNVDENANESEELSFYQLLELKCVNSFGTQEIKAFSPDSSKPIRFSETMHIAADWSQKAYVKYMTNQWVSSEVVHESADPSTTNRRQQQGVQLSDCVKLFTTKEQLDKDDAWYCSSCKKHQQATKKFDLWALPPVLVIHLKRFSYTRFYRDKLDTLVNFPLKDLDLTEFIVNPTKKYWPKEKRCYNLIGVSNHYGGLGGGHYTAYAKNSQDGEWHYFDDSSVSLSSETRVVTKAAYMLVYQRQDMEAWLADRTDEPFPFLEPIQSPRGNVGGYHPSSEPNGTQQRFSFSGESYIEDEDAFNNNVDAMDVSS